MENGSVLHRSTIGFVASVARQLFVICVVLVRLHWNDLLLFGNITVTKSEKSSAKDGVSLFSATNCAKSTSAFVTADDEMQFHNEE